MRPIRFIVVHTAASYDAGRQRVVHQTVEAVRRFHTLPVQKGGRGWRDIGYHRYIEQDGAVRIGRVDAVVGAHAENFNAQSLGICCSGHGDYEPFNAAQLDALVEQCAVWCRLYSIDPEHVIGHRETPRFGGPPVSKTCPGKLVDMAMIRHRVRDELGGVVAQPAAAPREPEPLTPTQPAVPAQMPRREPTVPHPAPKEILAMAYDPKLTPAAVAAVDAFLGALNMPSELRQGIKVVGSLEAPVAAAVTALIAALGDKDEGEARKAYEAARRAAFAARQK